MDTERVKGADSMMAPVALYVGNIPPHYSEMDLQYTFLVYGQPLGVYIYKQLISSQRTWGEVVYASDVDAYSAIEDLNGKPPQNLIVQVSRKPVLTVMDKRYLIPFTGQVAMISYHQRMCGTNDFLNRLEPVVDMRSREGTSVHYFRGNNFDSSGAMQVARVKDEREYNFEDDGPQALSLLEHLVIKGDPGGLFKHNQNYPKSSLCKICGVHCLFTGVRDSRLALKGVPKESTGDGWHPVAVSAAGGAGAVPATRTPSPTPGPWRANSPSPGPWRDNSLSPQPSRSRGRQSRPRKRSSPPQR